MDLILKYKNFLEQDLSSSDFETKIRAQIALENFQNFLESQKDLEEKIYD